MSRTLRNNIVRPLHPTMKVELLELIGLFVLHFYLHGALALPETQLERQGKFWPIGLVRFANNVCTSLEGFDGTCYRASQCTAFNGIASGSCALNGIGTCCIFQRTCGGSSAYNNTYFINSGFPATVTGGTQCTFTIIPCPNICQVRLDFLNFNLAQPDGNGYCVFDSFTVTGSASNVPVLCGDNTGQHMYLMVNNGTNIQLTITTSAAVVQDRGWNIKVTQIACDCPTLAPIGCLQYFTDLSGTVMSFNYGTTINGALVTLADGTTRPGTRQIANQNYGICVNMSPGYCSIQWSQGADATSFTVSGNTALVAVTPGLPGNGLVGENCTTDFVVIPNPMYVNGTAVVGDRFCGNQFPTVVTSSKPFVLTVVTDGDELTDVANRGFLLNYQQLPCTNAIANQVFVG